MAAFNYIPDALSSLQSSTELLHGIKFSQTRSLTRCVLGSEADFETHLIRDAAPHELALFDLHNSNTTTTRVDSSLDPDQIEPGVGDKWTATKRGGPARRGGWDRPSPLKRRPGTSVADDPERCLRAAVRLLDVYPMPRASEHVQALHQQYEGLQDTIAELEETLKRPPSRSSSNPFAEEYHRAAELEEQIKREQMEIFALEQIQAEKRAEIAAKKKVPAAKVAPARKVPAPKPTSAVSPSSARDPFAKSSLLEKKQTTPVDISGTSTTSATRPPVANGTPSPRKRVGSAPASATPKRAIPEKVSSPSTPPARRTSPRKASGSAEAPRSMESTPKAAAAVASTSQPKKNKAMSQPSTSNDLDLALFSARIWTGMGEVLRPWDRSRRRAAGETASTDLSQAETEADATRATLEAIVSAPPASRGPVSPQHSIISSSLASTDIDDEPAAPQAGTVLEAELLRLLLATLAGSPPPGEPALTVTLRDPVLPSSLVAPPSPSQVAALQGARRGGKDPMVSMNALKARLAQFAQSRGLAEDLGTSAMYALVSRTILRIDRRGKEGPMVGFRLQ